MFKHANRSYQVERHDEITKFKELVERSPCKFMDLTVGTRSAEWSIIGG